VADGSHLEEICMTQHRSLKARGGKGGQFRSVLKRLERIKKLEEEGKFDKDSSCFGLPKVKTLRLKVKSKAAEEKVAEAAETTAEATEEKAVEKKEEKKKK
jgi:small basic protein (TIGR04137 family)